jgi:hypothetical protein
MKEIIFAKTRYFYQSYTDFWSLVELSGFHTCFVDEIDFYNQNNVYIFAPMNGEWRPLIDNKFPLGFDNRSPRATLVMWNLERPGEDSIGNFAVGNQALIGRYLDRVIVSDRELARLSRLDYVTLGGHEGLGNPGKFEYKRFDLIHLSCYSNHRSFLFDAPDRPKRLLNGFTIAQNGWHAERDIALMSARYMLNIHQDSHPFIEPLRFVLAAMYGLPIISEGCIDAYPYNDYIFPYPEMKLYINSYDYELYEIGLRLRKSILNEFPFRKCVENYVRKELL